VLSLEIETARKQFFFIDAFQVATTSPVNSKSQISSCSFHVFLDCRTAAIQEHVTAILRSIPKEVFADSFQKIYERCQPCLVKDGDYFEGQ
jgi:hypothetical protein